MNPSSAVRFLIIEVTSSIEIKRDMIISCTDNRQECVHVRGALWKFTCCNAAHSFVSYTLCLTYQ